MLNYRNLRDALKLGGWSDREIDNFIQKNPRVWLQALNMRLIDAVNNIEVFLAESYRDEISAKMKG